MAEGRARQAKTSPEPAKHPDLERLAHYRWLFILALISLVVVVGLVFLALFEPPLPYAVSWRARQPNDSPEFLRAVFALTSGWANQTSGVEVFTNGDQFYPAELAAIRAARQSVHLTAYIMSDGEVAARFLDALTERARAGVEVKIVIDAVGSAGMPAQRFKRLTDAGGRVAWFGPLKWYTWPRIGNRTHREVLVVDGKIGFAGGAGIADHWLLERPGEPRWRDMMVRVEGEAVPGLQASFADDWLKAAGEVLADPANFPRESPAGSATVLVVSSTPTNSRSTAARVLFQTLIASATRTLYISTPYFLPDHALRNEIARAARDRHVDVRVVIPGPRNDHRTVYHASRRLYGGLLGAGVRIFEYQPSMNHTKALTVDGLWTVVGSTNVDTRSFGLNDEVNLAVRDAGFARRIERDFFTDIGKSRPVSYAAWKRRGLFARLAEWAGSVFERQE